MKPIVFFDLDGTLTDPGLGITNSVLYALKTYGIEEKREHLYSFIGPPLVDSFQERYGFSREKAFEAVRRFQEYFSEKGMFENRVYDGVPAMLRALRERGKTLVLATSKPEVFAERILRHFSLDALFDHVCGSDLDEKSRATKAEVIAYALEKSGAVPQDCVMIGDRKYDILGAKKYGLAAVGVLYGYGTLPELAGAGADRLAATVSELETILMK